MPTSGARYDEVADLYRELNPGLDDELSSVLLRLVGPVQGRSVLDLACGAGRVARELARRGALVTGLDLSKALLDYARAAEHAEPLGIEYLQGDCSAPEALAGRRFEAVVSHFGLSDIDDLDGCLATVARVLSASGAFTFSMLHPCFPGFGPAVSASWPRGGYQQEGFWVAEGPRSTLRRRVGANHRMLSTYLNSLVQHGLRLDEVAEPGPEAGLMAGLPGAESVPVFLAVRCRRA